MELFGESSIQVIVGITLSAAAFVLHLIGFATPYWYKVGIIHMGLWQSCGTICVAWVDFPYPLSDQFKAAQAMECLAFMAFLAVIACIVLKLFVMKDQTMLYIVISLANFAAGGFAMLGVIIFGTLDGYDSSKFHFSLAFCVIASLAAFVSGFMFFLGRTRATT